MSPTAPSPRRAWTRTARAAAILLTGLLTASGGTQPASAAGSSDASGSSDDARYYRSEVTSIEPATDGLRITVQGSGESVTLENGTGRDVVVLGYAGEPYLRFGADGVAVNSSSLSAQVNVGSSPADTSGPSVVTWKHLQHEPRYTWSDYRVRWSPRQRPPIVVRDEHSEHRVFDWALPLTVDGGTVLVRGAVDWTGTPRFSTLQLVLATLLLVALLGPVVAALSARRGRRTGRRTGRRGGLRPDPDDAQHLPERVSVAFGAAPASDPYADFLSPVPMPPPPPPSAPGFGTPRPDLPGGRRRP